MASAGDVNATRGMNDVWFSINPGQSVNLNPVPVSAEIAALPDIAGMGNVPSLHQAMARDTSGILKGLVKQWMTSANTLVTRSGNDMVFKWSGNTTDSVTVKDVFNYSQLITSSLLETVSFADGASWKVADLMARLNQDGTANADTIYGVNDHANRIKGLAGDDYLLGGALADVIEGGDGNDTLNSGAGADTLTGGKGNDTVTGGAGNDTYLFNRGDGLDTIHDADATSGNNDILQFGAGIAHNQVWLRKSGNDLSVAVIGSADGVLVKDWYAGAAHRIEAIKTSDNQTILHSQVDALVQAMAAFAPPAAGQSTLPTHYQTALGSVIAASWN